MATTNARAATTTGPAVVIHHPVSRGGSGAPTTSTLTGSVPGVGRASGLHPMSVSREDVAEIGVAVTLRPTSCVEVRSGEQPAAQEPFKVTKDDSVAAAPDVGKLPAAHAVVQHVAGQVMSGTAITAHSPERGWVTN